MSIKWEHRMIETELDQYRELIITLDSHAYHKKAHNNVLTIMDEVGVECWELISLTYPSVSKSQMIFKRPIEA
jgi:hypothetical protein